MPHCARDIDSPRSKPCEIECVGCGVDPGCMLKLRAKIDVSEPEIFGRLGSVQFSYCITFGDDRSEHKFNQQD